VKEVVFSMQRVDPKGTAGNTGPRLGLILSSKIDKIKHLLSTSHEADTFQA
jgi:hypothetical protein